MPYDKNGKYYRKPSYNKNFISKKVNEKELTDDSSKYKKRNSSDKNMEDFKKPPKKKNDLTKSSFYNGLCLIGGYLGISWQRLSIEWRAFFIVIIIIGLFAMIDEHYRNK